MRHTERGGTGRREPSPTYLSTAEQFGLAFVTVVALMAIVLPVQLAADGIALWLPVGLGALAIVVAWAQGVRAVLRRARNPAAKPPPEISMRRRVITSAALLVGMLAISVRLLLFD